MTQSLTIVGGTYLETCLEPDYRCLFGSGLRAAAALSERKTSIKFFSCIGPNELDSAKSICDTFGLEFSFTEIIQTCGFHYYHPLSDPEFDSVDKVRIDDIRSQNILAYGMIEADVKIVGEYVVYDPQNNKSFRSSGSEAAHLALVLNKNEFRVLSNTDNSVNIMHAALDLQEQEQAEVIIVKDGPRGAFIIEKKTCTQIPVFETKSVWPIGSGDIFSAVFAYHWMIERKSAQQSALLASMFTAHYCEAPVLPLPQNVEGLTPLRVNNSINSVYLAGL